MTARKPSTPTDVVIPADAYRAFADWLTEGNTGSFDEWFASDAGKTAVEAWQAEQANKEKSARMALAKAVWRDFRANGTISTDKGKTAARELLTLLKGLDLTDADESAEDSADPE